MKEKGNKREGSGGRDKGKRKKLQVKSGGKKRRKDGGDERGGREE